MIPMPLLMWFATLTGQPVVVIIAPGEPHRYEIQTPKPEIKKSEVEVSGCRTVVCRA